eukprot:gene16372-11705_t
MTPAVAAAAGDAAAQADRSTTATSSTAKNRQGPTTIQSRSIRNLPRDLRLPIGPNFCVPFRSQLRPLRRDTATMTTLADDLLKNKPIADLRVLIKQLNKDAEDKKTELRSMVGSQYHQFIQSADKISEMHDQSKVLLASLDQFWERNQDFVSQMQRFLHKDAQTTSAGQQLEKLRSGKSRRLVLTDVTPSQLWKDIGDCDVYRAATRILVAAAVLAAHSPAAAATLNAPWLATFLNEDAHRALASYEASAATLQELRSCLFLRETVIDDARMICGGGNDDIFAQGLLEEKAKTFAALQTLQALAAGAAPPPLGPGGSLLELFLARAAAQLDQLLETQLAPASAEAIARGLVALVSFLQRLVFDTRALFFAPVAAGAPGLVAFFALQLQTDVHRQLGAAPPVASDSGAQAAATAEALATARGWFRAQLRK